jgi:serine/threonine protein kinase
LEELLGKQPGNLAGYLRQKPPQMNELIHALVAATDALVTRYAATGKGGGLTPESICFDRMGKATIRVSTSTVPQGSTLDGVVGSPRYAAPEIFAEKSAGADAPVASADIYALGFMFYEILLGRELFQKTFAGQKSDLDWLRWHADPKSKAPLLKTLLPEHPAALSELLESMMAKDAARRMTDPATILSRLRGIAQQADKTVIVRKPAPQMKPPARRTSSLSKGRKTIARLSVAVILALVISGFVTWKNPNLHRKLLYWLHNSVHIHSTASTGQSGGPAQ